MEFDTVQLGVEFGGGTAIGFLSGYATKKLFKLLAVIVGLELALLKFLEAEGIVDVHWSDVRRPSVHAPEAVPEVESLASTLPIGGGFAMGAAMGLRKG